MRSNGKRNTAVILVPVDAAIPRWVRKSGDAKISLGRINGGRTVRRLDIDFAQVNFAEKGSVVIRSSGSRSFLPLLGPGIALAVSDKKGNLVLNAHLCDKCFRNSGRFVRDRSGKKPPPRKQGEYNIYPFFCVRCGNKWEVFFSSLNGNGNGNGSSHHKPKIRRGELIYLHSRK